MTAADRWVALLARCAELDQLRAVSAVLGWDQQTFLPARGAAARGEQLALLARLHHQRLTDPVLADLLAGLADDALPSRHARAVTHLTKRVARAVRVPPRLVEALARAEADGFAAWLRAKAEDDFPGFAPALATTLALKREQAAAIDSTRPAYDVLLDEFDPGVTTATLRPLFARLAAALAPLLDDARDRPDAGRPPGAPVAAQRPLHDELLAAVGFDGEAGRLDDSEHPFSVGVAAGDVRITTHLHADDVLHGLGSTLHEAGHGLYEQGLPRDLPGTTLDEAASYGLHESQSRFWENQIGRSLAFQRWLAPRLRRHLGWDVSPEQLHAWQNPVRPGLVRIAADETTYNLHIIVRFELELGLVEGQLAVADLPAAWGEGMLRTLGVVPSTDREGCLQDVHWSGGAFGYFPSYTLGNLYAARLGAAIRRQLDVDAAVEAGSFAPILAWLRQHVHVHGHGLSADEIVDRAAGPHDGVTALVEHLRAAVTTA